MIWQRIFAAASLLAAHQVHAGSIDAVADAMALVGRRSSPAGSIERRMADVAGVVPRAAVPEHGLHKRQSGGSMTISNSTGVVVNADGTINMTAWENTVNTACMEALSKLPVSTNPSGTCICYNLPALDNTTGTFEADLRLYQLSTPTGDFTGIPPQNIEVRLGYSGASVSQVTPQTANKLVEGRQAATTSSSSTGLKLMQTYLFVGQIQEDQMEAKPDMAQLEALVMPTVTLTGTNGAGQNVSTNVSSNEAAFVAGVFSNMVVMSDLAITQAVVQGVVDGLANNTVAFILPGVQLMLFPIGLIITSVWLVLGLVAYGIGTYERMNYREQYRQRTARAGKSGANRI